MATATARHILVDTEEQCQALKDEIARWGGSCRCRQATLFLSVRQFRWGSRGVWPWHDGERIRQCGLQCRRQYRAGPGQDPVRLPFAGSHQSQGLVATGKVSGYVFGAGIAAIEVVVFDGQFTDALARRAENSICQSRCNGRSTRFTASPNAAAAIDNVSLYLR